MNRETILAAGLDVGSTHTRCAVAVLEGDRFRLLGYGLAPSKGWVRSRIVDQQAVTECVSAAVRQAEEMAQVTVETVVAGMGGVTVRGGNRRGTFRLGRPQEITRKHVIQAMADATRVKMPADQMLLQVLPQDFVVDDQPGFHDPRQLLGSVLEANAHLVTCSSQEHNNLVGAINRAHLAVDETIFEAVAACYASVLPEERQEGVVVVDIGQHSTEIVCYFGESGQFAASLTSCGDHFSRDVAHPFRIPIEAAAIVKEQFGSAVAGDTPENSVVELPPMEGKEPRDVSRRKVNEILESRAVDLFEKVREQLKVYRMENAVGSGVVVCGGGARLARICDVAEEVLKCTARPGLAQGILDWPEELNDPAWATAAGLAMYSARLRSQVDVVKQTVGVLGRFLR